MNSLEIHHNKFAPFWAIAMFIFATTGILTTQINLGTFWKSYVLDITGPAWNYILFRGLFTKYSKNRWTNFFTPLRTVVIFIIVCLLIEGIQYFDFYKSTFDVMDIVAYISILIPLFFIDYYIENLL